MLEAEKHASQQREDYELYELQRRRREQEVLNLASERDQWSSAAYKLALKVIFILKFISIMKLNIDSSFLRHITYLKHVYTQNNKK